MVENLIMKFYGLNVEEDIKELENKNVLIFKFGVEDTEHLNLISHIIENIEKDVDEETLNSKLIFFIIHIKRIFKNEKNDASTEINNKNYISHLNEQYEQIFIDNLNAPKLKYKFMDVIGDKSNKHIFREINLFNSFSDLIYEIYNTFQIENMKEFGQTSAEYINKIIQLLKIL